MRFRPFSYVTVLWACSSSPPPAPPPPIPDPVAVEAADPPVVPWRTESSRRVTTELDRLSRQRRRARDLVATARVIRQDDDGAPRAAALLQSAVQADPTSVEAHWELGWTWYGLENWEAALAAWQTLAELAPRHPGLARYVPIAIMRRDAAARSIPLTDPVTPALEEAPRDGERVRIAAVGDMQLGMGWPADRVRLPPDDASGLFARVAPMLRDADITFGNLETALADSGDSRKCRPTSQNCYAFRAPTRFARAVRDAGFDVLSINNNHAGDFGEAGRTTTAAALDAVYIVHSGPASGVASWETKGLRIALIAFSTGEGPFRIQDIATARQQVIDADRDHDVVIVSFHGGAEGAGATRVPKAVERAYGEDRGDVYAFAHAMVDSGADLILGHGPHVLRGMETYRGRFIAYSLGNFSSWDTFNLRGPLGLSVILQVDFAPNGVVTDARLHPIFLDDPGIPTPDDQRRAIAIVRQLSESDFGDPLFDVDGRYRPPTVDGTGAPRR